MPTLTIEMNRGHGWETRSCGDYTGSLDDIRAALPAYAVQYPHRAVVDGVVVATAEPVHAARSSG